MEQTAEAEQVQGPRECMIVKGKDNTRSLHGHVGDWQISGARVQQSSMALSEHILSLKQPHELSTLRIFKSMSKARRRNEHVSCFCLHSESATQHKKRNATPEA